MIWVAGEILPDDGLTISVLDRTFEHGLGLFETLRTWGGRATLLDRHKARMLRSADELKLPIDPADLPDLADVRDLLEAEGFAEDRMLRITVTGGTTSGPSVVWMRSSSLPPSRDGGAIICVNAWSLPIFYSSPPLPGERRRTRGVAVPVAWGDEEIGPLHPPDHFTSRHKTLNYWSRRVAFEQARDLGYDEVLFMDDSWGFTEASRSNLFLVGGDELITISTEAPIVPGIMRRLVLDAAEGLLLKTREARQLGIDQLASASEVFLTNAVRGIIPVVRIDAPGETFERPSPGPWARLLQELIARQVWPGRGDTP